VPLLSVSCGGASAAQLDADARASLSKLRAHSVGQTFLDSSRARRSNTACDARINVFLYTWGAGRQTLEGEHIPVRVEPMTMDTHHIESMLLLPTVLEHTIDERSPLFHLSHDELTLRNAEVVVTFEAVSDFGDTFMVRRSYLPSEIHWGSFFVPITQKAGPGSVQHLADLSRFHDVVPMEGLPAGGSAPPGELSCAVLAGGVPQAPRTLPYPSLGDNTLVVSYACVITARDKARCLAFRVGDTRPGQMLEVHVRGYLYEWAPRTSKEGETQPYTMKARRPSFCARFW
jgi:Inward rectifier potassium channel C-terminal domain